MKKPMHVEYANGVLSFQEPPGATLYTLVLETVDKGIVQAPKVSAEKIGERSAIKLTSLPWNKPISPGQYTLYITVQNGDPTDERTTQLPIQISPADAEEIEKAQEAAEAAQAAAQKALETTETQSDQTGHTQQDESPAPVPVVQGTPDPAPAAAPEPAPVDIEPPSGFTVHKDIVGWKNVSGNTGYVFRINGPAGSVLIEDQPLQKDVTGVRLMKALEENILRTGVTYELVVTALSGESKSGQSAVKFHRIDDRHMLALGESPRVELPPKPAPPTPAPEQKPESGPASKPAERPRVQDAKPAPAPAPAPEPVPERKPFGQSERPAERPPKDTRLTEPTDWSNPRKTQTTDTINVIIGAIAAIVALFGILAFLLLWKGEAGGAKSSDTDVTPSVFRQELEHAKSLGERIDRLAERPVAPSAAPIDRSITIGTNGQFRGVIVGDHNVISNSIIASGDVRVSSPSGWSRDWEPNRPDIVVRKDPSAEIRTNEELRPREVACIPVPQGFTVIISDDDFEFFDVRYGDDRTNAEYALGEGSDDPPYTGSQIRVKLKVRIREPHTLHMLTVPNAHRR